MIRGTSTSSSRLIIEYVIAHTLLQVVVGCVILSRVIDNFLHLSVRITDSLSFNVNQKDSIRYYL